MPEQTLLRDLILTYALALLFVVGLARLRVPPIVALITAGIVAGPAGIGIVRTQQEVDALAEIGVVLLLFTVGLDFSLAEIRRIWKSAVLAGSWQITATASAVLALFLVVFRGSWQSGILIGLFVGLSSTAIVLKELGARNQLDSPHGRLMVGVLLFQDLCLVVVLMAVPILSGRTPAAAVPVVILRVCAALAAVALLGRIVLPVLLRAVARSGQRETFGLAVLLASIGTAWVSSLFGISMALGAFFGGLLLAESEFSHQAHAEVRPLRDSLAGLFFISLGMLVDPSHLLRSVPLIAAVTGMIVLMKTVIATAALLMVAAPLRVAATAGLGLAQVGEFSFILGRAGLDAGLLTPTTWQRLLAASVLTMALTPSLLAVAPRAGSWIARRMRRPIPSVEPSGIPTLSDHVIILGFGVGGQLLGRALRDLGIPYLVMDLNGATVRRARASGEPIVYGDATTPDTLDAAGVTRARAVAALLSDPQATSRMVAATRVLAPAVPIIVRARYRAEADHIARLGATTAVAEELEASLEVIAQLLIRLDVPGNVITALLDGFRGGSTTARPLRAPRAPLDTLPLEITQAPVATHQVRDGDWAVGRTLADLDLRVATGVSVLAVRRGSKYVTSPPANLPLEGGDVLYVLGDENGVLRARNRMTAGS